jgi:hypothetical protein
MVSATSSSEVIGLAHAPIAAMVAAPESRDVALCAPECVERGTPIGVKLKVDTVRTALRVAPIAHARREGRTTTGVLLRGRSVARAMRAAMGARRGTVGSTITTTTALRAIAMAMQDGV